jgi:hypothetical protein
MNCHYDAGMRVIDERTHGVYVKRVFFVKIRMAFCENRAKDIVRNAC